MAVSATKISRRLTTRLLLGLLAVTATAVADPARAETKPAVVLRFALDRPIDAAAAPFTLAMENGLFRAAGLKVSISAAANTRDAISRVASGAADVALPDLNALIRYRDAADAAPIKAVFIVQDKAPYAIIARKSRGVTTLASLDGKTIGVADGDMAIRMWPALARHNNVKLNGVKQEKISAAVREPMLSAGQVDAVTGYSFLSAINLRDRGIPADDLAIFRFSDFGSRAYGATLIVNPRFAADNPDAVRGFLRAVSDGIRLTTRSPAAAVDSVIAQMPSGSRELETERLRAILHDALLTREGASEVLGAIDATRFDASVNDIADDFNFRKRPALRDIFDDSYLPGSSERTTN